MNTPAPSPRLSHDQMHAVLTDWHAQCVDDPLYAHIQTSFEDMADQLWSAMKALKTEQAEAMWFENNPRNWTGSNVYNLSQVQA